MFKKICIVNGNEFKIDRMELHLEDLVKKVLKDKKIKVAVAVNNRLVMKSDWKKKKILNGDVIEIVRLEQWKLRRMRLSLTQIGCPSKTLLNTF